MVTALARLGVNVTALVTGLGIGGIALALAVQNVLGDLLAALAIIFDKPFDVGDSITVGETSGTVERIGLKTTRLRSVAGEQVIVSNSELLKSRIHNFRRLLERRVVLTLGVTYDTSPDLLARIPEMLEEIVSAEQPVRFERAHFSAFGESALRFETVYFVLDSDYTKYMDIQHSINLAVLQRFDKERIRFAYPTRTVLVEGKS
jgi:small-conductance mechanosensitive channel